MIADPAYAIKHQVHQLVDLQIETLRQPCSLTTSDLLDYRGRSKKNHGAVPRTGPDTKSGLQATIARSILELTLSGLEGVEPPSAAFKSPSDGGLFYFKI